MDCFVASLLAMTPNEKVEPHNTRLPYVDASAIIEL